MSKRKISPLRRFRWIRGVVPLLILLAIVLSGYTAAASLPAAGAASDSDNPNLCATTPPCVGFESLTLGATYHVGDSFVDSGAVITAHPFVWSNGTPTSDGYAQVGNAGLAGGAGLEMQVNNINLEFDFGQPLVGLSLKFGEYGGNLNIEINGDFRNFQNFADIHGLVIGGVQVVVANGLGNDKGHLGLTGVIHDFSVGGQELWLDDVCPEFGHRVLLPLVLKNVS
jgi:hypothetical protein